FYRIIASGNQEQIQAAIDAKQEEINITKAQIAENKRVFEELENQVGTFGRGVFDVFNVAGTQELRNETQKLEQSLTANEFAVSRLEGAMNDTSVVTRTLEQQETALAAVRK